MKLSIGSKAAFKGLLAAIAVLLAAHLLSLFVKHSLGHPRAYGFVPLFNLDHERNIPTFFSALMLTGCAFLLWLISTAQRRSGGAWRLWYGLMGIFAFLAVDESVSIHERLIRPIRETLDVSGAFHFAWVIPYGFAVLIVGALYLRFLLSVGKRTAWLFVASGSVYVSGALGLELVSGYIASSVGIGTAPYVIATTIEELLEMLGLALFAFALIEYMEIRFERIVVSIGR